MIEISYPAFQSIIDMLKKYSFDLEYSTSAHSSHRKDEVDFLVKQLEALKDG